jgi:hypothetical protein
MKYLVLFLMLLTTVASGQLSNTQTQALPQKNLLDQSNPGFENGKAKWTASSAATFTLETAGPLIGAGSGKFDSTTTGQTVDSAAITIPAGLQGRQCLVKMSYRYDGTTGDYTLAVKDGSNNDMFTALQFADTDNLTRTIEAGFICPTSGTIKVQIASTADGAALLIDEVWLGGDYRIGKQDGAELVAHAYYEQTTGCAWATTSTSLAAFPTDADCPSITVISSNYPVDTTDNNLPDIDFDNLPPGIYEVTAQFMISGSTTNMSWTTAISDGTNVYGLGQGGGSSNFDNDRQSVTAVFKYETAGARNFAIHGATSTATSTISNNATGRSVVFIVKRYPLTPTDSVTLETQGWYASGNITGANVSLPTTTSAYDTLDDSGLTLSNNTGSATCQIACTDGISSSGLNCGASAENVGVACTVPKAGAYRACFEFTDYVIANAGAQIYMYYKLGETANDDDGSLLQESTFAGMFFEPSTTGDIHGNAINICHNFYFSSAGKKTIRLYRDAIISGTVTTHRIEGIGSRGEAIKWSLIPLTQNFPQAVALTNKIGNNSQNELKLYSVAVDVNDAGNSITGFTQLGNWVSSVAWTSEGVSTITVSGGIFSVAPFCWGSSDANHEPGGTYVLYRKASSSSTSLVVNTVNAAAAVNDEDYILTCMGY